MSWEIVKDFVRIFLALSPFSFIAVAWQLDGYDNRVAQTSINVILLVLGSMLNLFWVIASTHAIYITIEYKDKS